MTLEVQGMRLAPLSCLLLFLSLAPLGGCGSGYGPDTLPIPLASVTLPSGPYQLISELGCAKQDVDLTTGRGLHGSSATDDAPCINAALAQASPQRPVVLVQDGASLVSGIRGPVAGNWSIYGMGGGFRGDGSLTGTGFFQKAGTNDDVIHNGGPGAGCPFGVSDPGTVVAGPPPARGAHITLHNFVINGNRGNGHNGNSTHGVPQGVGSSCWYMGINIMDMDDVDISGIAFFNTSSYNLRLSNVGSSTIDHSIFANTGPYPTSYVAQNGDGTHIDGPANDIVISDNLYVTTDDAIALNAPEGWGGLIQNVTIKNSTVRQGASLLRAYTRSQFVQANSELPSIANVTIDNLSGVAMICGFIGEGGAHAMPRLRTISNFKWTNSTCTADSGTLLTENVADLTFSNFTWNSGAQNVGFINLVTGDSHADKLSFEDITINRSRDTLTGLISTYEANSSLNADTISVDGLKIVNTHGDLPKVRAVLALSAPSYINHADLTNIDFTNIAADVSNPAQVGQVTTTLGSSTAVK
jgi:hypothetical protein